MLLPRASAIIINTAFHLSTMTARSELKKKIYNLLKSGTLTELEIWMNLDEKYTERQISLALADLVDKDQTVVESKGYYSLKIVLDHVYPSPPENQYYKYERIIQEVGEELPKKYRNKWCEYVAWRGQGDRGTCFAGRTRVLMGDMTYKPIEYVKEGELVYTHGGRKKRVIEKMKRKWQGNTYKIHLVGISDPIECTVEHPFLTHNRGWVAVSGLTTSDMIYVPSLSSEIYDKTLNEWERDPDFLWVLGLYLAEGSIDIGSGGNGSRVVFSLHSREVFLAERVKQTMGKYGVSVTYAQKGENGLVVRLSADWNKHWCEVFEDLGGKMCYGKKIHQRLMTLNPKLQMNIFDGWFSGDGYTRTRGGVTERVGVSTSRVLIDQMHRILLRNGIYSCVANRFTPENRLDAWGLVVYNEGVKDTINRISSDEGFYIRVYNIEKVGQYLGEHVYNLEVEDDHSYIVEGVAAHNCVGQSGAYLKDIYYLQFYPDQIPTAEELAQSKESFVEPCGMVCYKLLPKSFSAECVYQVARKIGNVKYPSGAYVHDSVKGMQKVGTCLERNWYTSRTSRCAAADPYPYTPTKEESEKRAYEEAGRHKTEGYAQIGSLAGVKQAIYKHGAAYGAVIVYSNYMSGKVSGVFPERKGSSEAGGHALVFIGWDDDKRILECLHSWQDGGWPKYGGISYDYFDYGGIEFFAVLDSEEFNLAQGIYSVLEISSNVEASYVVTDPEHPEGVVYPASKGVKVSIGRGSEYKVVATPKDSAAVVEENLAVSGTASMDRIPVAFNFTTKTSPQPQGDLMKKILELLKKILGSLKR